MKKIKTRCELLEEKMVLQQKAINAEKDIKESWKQLKIELSPINLLKENILSWFKK